MDSIDKKTGEVYELEPLDNLLDLEKLINSLLLNQVTFSESLAMLLGFRIKLYRRKPAFQDGMFNAYAEKLDFSEDSKYWKSTFDAKKIRDQLMVENKEYSRQSREVDKIQDLLKAIDALEALTKSMMYSSWGHKGAESD